MNHQVQVFEVPQGAKPSESPRLLERFSVGGDTVDDARRAAMARLRADGRTVRALSFLAEGGLAAVVTPPAPAAGPGVAPKARSAKGAR
jgi:hypothetical protein